ncbi:MAG TPA: glycoside hydrolase family 38 C-terminal domain-containing protein [Gemmatimonadaceae bacterium]|nr:glycoside hydrolase family 38 C-terminal domain-containing protein [Gemmatimonadaceae bacterium]
MHTLHVVSHTHWDREWYHPAGRFRQRLVALVDELLDQPPAGGASFLLDGQTVVLDDYVAVRPERAAELAAALRDGALEAGPWFVLADELIPGGEALVRNLLAGRRTLRALGVKPPPVLYCPDAFGHPAALPTLARGFGLDLVIAWRGFGSRRWPPADACWWRAPSGDRVLLYHLPRSGYEFGAGLPADPAAAASRWRRMRDELAPRSRLRVALVPNGADHHARQRQLDDAVAALADAAAPTRVEASSLRAFAVAALASAAHADLPVVQGELRDSYGYTWTLQGTLATRAHQKRRAARLERILTREAEPWSALAARRSGRSRRALMAAAWHELLLGHPHDTLCGCSIDTVARAFDARLDEAWAQAVGVRADAVAALAGHDAERARDARDEWRPHLILRNPAPRARGGVAIVDLTQFMAHVPVGPGSGTGEAPSTRLAPPRVDGLAGVQLLERELVHERTESPRAYPDDDLVERSRAAVWVHEMPGYGLRAQPVSSGRNTPSEPPHPVRVERGLLSNGRLSAALHDDGRVTLRHHASGRTIADVIGLEDEDDGGDLYTPSPRGPRRGATLAGSRIVHRGPLRGALETRWRVAVRGGESVTVRIRLTLDADANVLRVAVAGENGADDHRLRVRFSTDIEGATVRADAAFGPVERVPLVLEPDETMMEAAPPTAPLHRYVTLTDARRGATLYSDGLAEYEAGPDGVVRVTLVRAVGQLSRHDLPERPGHAGWPAPTPQAQCRGPFAGEFALLLHDAWSDETADLVERVADDVLVPIAGATLRSIVSVAPEMPGLVLDGRGLTFSAAKESEDGAWLVLRCVNVLPRAVPGRWVVAGGVREARLSRLDETPGDALVVAGDAIAFDAPARGVVTVLVR